MDFPLFDALVHLRNLAKATGELNHALDKLITTYYGPQIPTNIELGFIKEQYDTYEGETYYVLTELGITVRQHRNQLYDLHEFLDSFIKKIAVVSPVK
jgi:hypothetical protein